MDFQDKAQCVVDGTRDGAQHLVKGTGTVLPVPFSHPENAVGIHWLRISFPKKHLADLAKFCSSLWGDFDADGFGLWSYDSRLAWHCGVSLNFDQDAERSARVHCGMMTLDCPGSALDETTAPDLQLLIEVCEAFGGKCSRIDVYFDDYARLVYPRDLHRVIKKRDYSGFLHGAIRQKYDPHRLVRDEVSFGERGSRGNGKYLRCYDKELESGSQSPCIRWEVEFSQTRADSVFKSLAQTKGDLDAFATLCGSLIAGCVTFVHRTGEKNIKRLKPYIWWRKIVTILGGEVSIRLKRKKDSLTGKFDWLKRNVSPSLACLRKVFVKDTDFIRWLFDVCSDGEKRMNRFTSQLAEDNHRVYSYSFGDLNGPGYSKHCHFPDSQHVEKEVERALSQL